MLNVAGGLKVEDQRNYPSSVQGVHKGGVRTELPDTADKWMRDQTVKREGDIHLLNKCFLYL